MSARENKSFKPKRSIEYLNTPKSKLHEAVILTYTYNDVRNQWLRSLCFGKNLNLHTTSSQELDNFFFSADNNYVIYLFYFIIYEPLFLANEVISFAIGGLQPISRDTDILLQCTIAGARTKGASEKFLFSFTNMAAMT